MNDRAEFARRYEFFLTSDRDQCEFGTDGGLLYEKSILLRQEDIDGGRRSC